MENGQQNESSTGDVAERTTRGTVTRDAESTALVRILKTLDELDDSARSRVVRYVSEKYESDLD